MNKNTPTHTHKRSNNTETHISYQMTTWGGRWDNEQNKKRHTHTQQKKQNMNAYTIANDRMMRSLE